MNITKTFFSLGTVNTVTLFDIDANSAEKNLNLIIKRVMEIDDRMSVFKNESDVYKISKITKGVFDITAGPLIKLWNIGDFSSVPKYKDIKKVKN